MRRAIAFLLLTDALVTGAAAQRFIVIPNSNSTLLVDQSGNLLTNASSALLTLPVVIPAVHFNGAAWLKSVTLTAPDSNVASGSFWVKVITPAPAFSEIYVLQPNYTTGAEIDGPTTVFNVYVGDTSNSNGMISVAVADGAWHNILWSANVSLNQIALYVDGVLHNDTPAVESPTTISINGLYFDIGNDEQGNFYTGDMANFWFAPISLLDGSGHIPSATIAKFIDGNGHATNPSGYPGGGLVLLTGNASTFATNQGSGGAFSVTGTLTSASTSP